MTVQLIQAQDLNIAGVFQAFYVVPDYQREYVWQSEQVEQLLADITAELGGSTATSAPEYFIGSIVVCPGPDGVLELIDGQQRMTTLFLLLCAIRDRIEELGQTASNAIRHQIAAESVDANGQDVFRYRLDLQYEDSGDVLVEIAEGRLGQRRNATRSIANIANAYQVAKDFLGTQFGDDIAAVRGFYGYLNNKVKLIRIQTEDVAKALKIFETINDRGIGLNSMDLLKNLLFMKASRDQFGRLRDVWKELQDTIFTTGEKPLRFLRYFIHSRYDVTTLREDETYGWLTKNEALCGYATAPLRFAEELRSAALAYSNFVQGNDKNGRKSRFLENLNLLGGSRARQHLILLLAGRHLPEHLFDRLCAEVESLFFAYVITHEPTRSFEWNFVIWAADLRKVRTEAELRAFFDERFAAAKRSLSARFTEAFRRLTTADVPKYRLRYILAKLTQKIDLDGFGENPGTMWLDRYAGPDFEIEHIFPQNPSPEALTEFGVYEDPEIAARLGNLALVERPINASLGNRPYSLKRPVYGESRALLTRAIARRPEVGTSTQIDRAVASLDPYFDWNEKAVASRQEQLVALARRVWDIPAAAGS